MSSFHQHFNPLVGALDPDLYTFPYTRQRSSLLFTVVLWISSRVFRPELRVALKEHLEDLLGKALLACDSSIETIWALICVYYWKDIRDKRGYNLVGFALSLASSAEWNTTRINSTRIWSEPTESEIQVRQRRDKQRAWLVLGNIDRS